MAILKTGRTQRISSVSWLPIAKARAVFVSSVNSKGAQLVVCVCVPLLFPLQLMLVRQGHLEILPQKSLGVGSVMFSSPRQ